MESALLKSTKIIKPTPDLPGAVKLYKKESRKQQNGSSTQLDSDQAETVKDNQQLIELNSIRRFLTGV